MEIQWPLVFFTLFVGLGSGIILAVVYLTEIRREALPIRMPGMILALVMLGLGGMSSTMHLGHPERIFGALGHPTSGIFMEAAVMGIVSFLVFVYLVALYRQANDGLRRTIGIAAAVLAFVMAFVNGDAYVMASRPAWNTWLLPFFYAVSAPVFGCFSAAVLMQRFCPGDAAQERLPRLTVYALILQAVVLLAYLVHIALAPYPAVTRSLGFIFTGAPAPLFWGGILAAGFVIPGILLRRGTRFMPLGLLCVLAGGIAFRITMFLIGSGVRNFFG